MFGAVSLAVGLEELIVDIVRSHEMVVSKFDNFLAIEMGYQLQSFFLMKRFLNAATISHSLYDLHYLLLFLFLLSLHKVFQREHEVHVIACHFGLTACFTCACEYLR